MLKDETLESIQAVSSFFSKNSFYIPSNQSHEEYLFSACQVVATQIGKASPLIKPTFFDMDMETNISSISQKNNFKYRQVLLTDNWHVYDNGPLVGFDKKTLKPLALIPSVRGNYKVFDPQTLEMKAYNSSIELEVIAYSFYNTLEENVTNWKEATHFLLKVLKNHFFLNILLQLGVLLLGLIPSYAASIFIEHIIPNANKSLLVQATLGLLAVTLSTSLFSFAEILSFNRLKFKAYTLFSPALWNKLLSLPLSFFKKHTTGDVSFQAQAVDFLFVNVSSQAFMAIVNSILSLTYLIFIFFINFYVGLIALGALIVMLIIALIFTLSQLPHYRNHFRLSGQVLGDLIQTVTNISKIKVANKEETFLNRWLLKFVKKSKFFYKAHFLENIAETSVLTIPSVATLCLFVFVYNFQDKITLSDFILLNGIFGQFLMAVSSGLMFLNIIVQAIPYAQYANPLITTPSEPTTSKTDPGTLSGDILIKDITFGYEKGRNILEKASLEVKSGEFIGVIGDSGTGKSTLFRLLLGFEYPEEGDIFYDNKKLSNLNISQVRAQIATILQTSVLMPGTLFENISNYNSSLSREEVIDLLNSLGLNNFLNGLPMGLETVISETGKTFSAGQRQSILLCRALARKPKILLLDEATSALDKSIQKKFDEMIEAAGITRLVIAQRHETLKNADKVYKLHEGKLHLINL